MDCERGGVGDAKGIATRLAELLGAGAGDSVRKIVADLVVTDQSRDKIYDEFTDCRSGGGA